MSLLKAKVAFSPRIEEVMFDRDANHSQPEIPPIEAAPMLCGGLTVFAPLVHNGCSPGKKVAVVGIGGLGHYAVQFAAALGAEVWAVSHSPKKQQDAIKMGAKHFVDTTKPNWESPLQQLFDFVISTSDCDEGFPLKQFMSTLAPLGRFVTSVSPDSC